ncbi:unnamed protein product [Paramecium sonneborni]|uniref:Uncharacterized protein n=1 Tax=Paramecium sonneborni TaxID=65129 RepID=A0A8S1RPB7_9CILI|nr:unnamed protein product [Paramecium sonneborni]
MNAMGKNCEKDEELDETDVRKQEGGEQKIQLSMKLKQFFLNLSDLQFQKLDSYYQIKTDFFHIFSAI